MVEQRKKYFASLDQSQQRRVKTVMEMLFAQQRDELDIAKLKGKDGMMRCRVGNLRIIFSIDETGKVHIETLGPRGDVYK